jgi:GTP-binding protein EngB required for normal cell division
LTTTIRNSIPLPVTIIKVNSLPTKIDEDYTVPLFGLLNLVQSMYKEIEQLRPHITNNASTNHLTQMKNFLSSQHPANIIVVGNTGSGKSTLVNTLFQFEGNEAAPTGKGVPVTQEIRQYSNSTCKLTIYDTRGFENDNFENYKKELEKLIKEKTSSINSNEFIYLGLVCVNSGVIFQSSDKNFCDLFEQMQIPFIIVVTKSTKEEDDNLTTTIRGSFLHLVIIIKVNSLPEEIDEDFSLINFSSSFLKFSKVIFSNPQVS